MCELQRLQELINYKFNDTAWLRFAVTHRSADLSPKRNYERLECVGDAALTLIVVRLYQQRQAYNACQLTLLRALVTSDQALRKTATRHGLKEFIVTGPSLGAKADVAGICADVLEAVVGAVLNDGGLEKATQVVTHLFDQELDQAEVDLRHCETRECARAQLPKFTQDAANVVPPTLPEYTEPEKSGEDHNPIFIVRVIINGRVFPPGSGHSKKAAKEEAAAIALAILTWEKEQREDHEQGKRAA